jgi:glycosyltransferase involved in cell wall biosynthesis
MRIVLDMQSCQTESRFRGIGRYSLSLAQALARQADGHELWVALNGLFPDTIEPMRAAFEDLIPQERIVVWHAPGPVAEHDPANGWRCRAGQYVREAFLASLSPDVVHVNSLFEGIADDAITSVGLNEGSMPTAVTLYDLIPLGFRDVYLPLAPLQDWYFRKRMHLKRAQLWLAISEHTRREGINLLGLPEAWVVNISAAADPMFRKLMLDEADAAVLRQRYGLRRPFVMYTGGVDHRKNIEGLIRAYALLPGAVRAAHHLVIVCKVDATERGRFTELAHHAALAADELVLTGYVPDEDLVALYNLCRLFLFPSLYEELGLPVLEAMASGAAVLGADTASLTEVIGRPDALFDPYREQAIASKMHLALTDEGFNAELRRHGLMQAKRFSAGESGKRALEAFERLHAENKRRRRAAAAAVHAHKPRLAYVSPLPPERSGIADYSAELLPDLASYYNIEVVVNQAVISDPWIRANCPIRSSEWFDQHAGCYERTLYHFGNSPFHRHMFRLLSRHPGAVVLHDFFFSHVLAYLERTGESPGGWTEALYASHGYGALRDRAEAQDPSDFIWKYPCNRSVLHNADGVIVHSLFSKDLAEQWYDGETPADCALIPQMRRPPATVNRTAARARLGLGEDDVLVCSFGILGPLKLNHQLLAVWLASPLARDARCHLVFVGEDHIGNYGAELLRMIGSSPAGTRVRITGFANSDFYCEYLAAADIAVQLRTLSRGETSRAVLDCMAYGVPTIVNAHGSLAELPDAAVVKLPDAFEDEHLAEAITVLAADRKKRGTVGGHAAAHIRNHHDPTRIAEQFYDNIERFADIGRRARLRGLAAAIVQQEIPQSPTEADWVDLAACIAMNQRRASGGRQFLVDISNLVIRDLKTGIERVVRSVVGELIAHPPAGFRIEPVYGGAGGVYRYARRFTASMLGLTAPTLEDEPVEAYPGDIFLGLACVPSIVEGHKGFFRQLCSRGIRVYVIVYDLLPMQRPDCFPTGFYDLYSRWADSLGNIARGAICISRAVARELAQWLDARQPAWARPFKIGYFHLGADISASFPTGGLQDGFKDHLQALSVRPTFLMVGTVEPRKGHAQAVAAFERLWAEGIEINLAIVGKQGWMIESLAERLCNHPELDKRLFWFNGASDEMLSRMYEHAISLLMTSEGEGFGLPLIEAAQHGLPIIARHLPVFREVAGEHAFYFHGFAPDDLATAVRTWLALWECGAAPRSAGMPWLTWEQSTAQLLDVILNDHWYAQWGSSPARMLKPQPPCGVATELSEDPETSVPTSDLQRVGGKMGIG